jgi:hypothetical protein
VRNSRKDEYSDNKTTYKYLRINQLYSLYNQHTYIIYITCLLKIISLTRKTKAKEKQMQN